jgi:uncharacterized membrane protein (DUF373 family)
MIKLLKKFERFVIIGLLTMMVVVVLIAAVELAILIVQDIIRSRTIVLLDTKEMLEVFGFFLVILIGLELIETMKVYLVDETVHVEIMFLVAIIAITRKVIILDYKTLPPLTLIGIAAIILALSVGYYALKRAMNFKKEEEEHEESKITSRFGSGAGLSDGMRTHYPDNCELNIWSLTAGYHTKGRISCGYSRQHAPAQYDNQGRQSHRL